jgi:hypothetical protein
MMASSREKREKAGEKLKNIIDLGVGPLRRTSGNF